MEKYILSYHLTNGEVYTEAIAAQPSSAEECSKAAQARMHSGPYISFYDVNGRGVMICVREIAAAVIESV